jgi:hypothetical protein
MSALLVAWGVVLGLLQPVSGLRAAQDEKTYDLRGPALTKGQVVHNKMVLKIQDADTTLKIPGEKPLEIKLTMSLVNEKESKVLLVDGRSVTLCRSKIIQDRSDITLGGSDQPDTLHGVLEGETVISERSEDGKWNHLLIDTKPTEKHKRELEERIGIESGDDLYPVEKIKIGHSWRIRAKSLTKVFDNAFTGITGELQQKFLKVEDLGGQTCGVVETTGSVKCKMKDEDGVPNMDVEMELKMISWRSLNLGTELKEKIEGKIKLSGPQKVNGETVNVSISGPISGEIITTIK